MRFHDRRDAGRQLAGHLTPFANRDDVIVLALPRGGVPVAFEVAEALAAPLDVFLVRKLGVPGQKELAMGAIASGGVRVINEQLLKTLQLAPEVIERVAARELQELHRREWEYRADRPPLKLRGKTVILVDDGLATGSSMRAALTALRRFEPACVVVAVPVGADDTCEELAPEADELICLEQPDPFVAVGAWYEDFSSTSDDDVCRLLNEALRASRSAVSN